MHIVARFFSFSFLALLLSFMMETSAVAQLVVKRDVVLIGSGIMSATLGSLISDLKPGASIEMIERLPTIASESSAAWNNAGTGHSALCELNYCPMDENGNIDLTKAIKVLEQYEVSKQYWSYLVNRNRLGNPNTFIHSVPHMSVVWGEENISYLKKRFDAMSTSHLFEGLEYSENQAKLKEWMPLVMQGDNLSKPIAASRSELGTDVDFGALTQQMVSSLSKTESFNLSLSQEVEDLSQNSDHSWTIKIKDLKTGKTRFVQSQFVFIGAGGGSLTLLQKSGIPEASGYGGFPVSGIWLICNNPDLIEQHFAKAYGKAAIGAPPMSVPHLDTRIINGKKSLLFGPFAGFSTKFLKSGSRLDLFRSVALDNIFTLLGAGARNLSLTQYLVEQVLESKEERLNALREFIPNAKLEDWYLADAGQRVQVMKNDPTRGPVIEFGTEVVSSADGSIAALLGASPGASTSVSVMLEVLKNNFKEEYASVEWQGKLKAMIPSFGKKLKDLPELTKKIRQWSHDSLWLNSCEDSLNP